MFHDYHRADDVGGVYELVADDEGMPRILVTCEAANKEDEDIFRRARTLDMFDEANYDLRNFYGLLAKAHVIITDIEEYPDESLDY